MVQSAFNYKRVQMVIILNGNKGKSNGNQGKNPGIKYENSKNKIHKIRIEGSGEKNQLFGQHSVILIF